MITSIRLLNITILSLLLTGCALPIYVKPLPPKTQISRLCIIYNPKVLMDGFLPELKSQIESYGIETAVYQEFNRAECPYWLEYTANWRWDFVMYLIYAEINVYDHWTIIGSAVFDNTQIGPRHYGAAKDKLKALTQPLFANNKRLSNT